MGNNKPGKKQLIKTPLRILLSIFAVMVLAALFLFSSFSIVTVDQYSMYPTFENGTKLIVSRISFLFCGPQAGDIIVFNSDAMEKNGCYVKRVAGLPGDNIIVYNGTVYRNGVITEEPYAYGEATDGFINTTLAENEYFVMGDNRTISNDSRNTLIGNISMKKIIGKVVFRLDTDEWIGSGIYYKENDDFNLVS